MGGRSLRLPTPTVETVADSSPDVTITDSNCRVGRVSTKSKTKAFIIFYLIVATYLRHHLSDNISLEIQNSSRSL